MASGERFLIGIVGQTIRVEFYPTQEVYSILRLPTNATLDMSNVDSITMTCTSYDMATIVNAFGTSVIFDQNHPTSQTVTFSPANGSISVGNIYGIYAYTMDNVNNCSITITSFTTTDGKVHTANNLNY